MKFTRNKTAVISVLIIGILLAGMIVPAMSMVKSGCELYYFESTIREISLAIDTYKDRYNNAPDHLSDLPQYPNGFRALNHFIKAGLVESINDVEFNGAAKQNDWVLSVKRKNKEGSIVYYRQFIDGTIREIK